MNIAFVSRVIIGSTFLLAGALHPSSVAQPTTANGERAATLATQIFAWLTTPNEPQRNALPKALLDEWKGLAEQDQHNVYKLVTTSSGRQSFDADVAYRVVERHLALAIQAPFSFQSADYIQFRVAVDEARADLLKSHADLRRFDKSLAAFAKIHRNSSHGIQVARMMISVNALDLARESLPRLETMSSANKEWFPAYVDYLTKLALLPEAVDAVDSPEDAQLHKALTLDLVLLAHPQAPIETKVDCIQIGRRLWQKMTLAEQAQWIRSVLQVGAGAPDKVADQFSEAKSISTELQIGIVTAILEQAETNRRLFASFAPIVVNFWQSRVAAAKQKRSTAENAVMDLRKTVQTGITHYWNPQGVEQYRSDLREAEMRLEETERVLARELRASPSSAVLDMVSPQQRLSCELRLFDLCAILKDARRAQPILMSIGQRDRSLIPRLIPKFLDVWSEVVRGTAASDDVKPQSINLYHVTQGMNLQELQQLMKDLEGTLKVDLAADYPESLVAAFSAAHSRYEVFASEAVQRIFRSSVTHPRVCRALAGVMLERLRGGDWSLRSGQDKAGTGRSDEEHGDELLRGFQLAERLLNDCLQSNIMRPAAEADTWRTTLLLAKIRYAWWVFGMHRKFKPPDAGNRPGFPRLQSAYDTFAKAASEYFVSLKAGTATRSLEVFEAWHPTLLAEDKRPPDSSIRAIRDAIISPSQSPSQRKWFAEAFADWAYERFPTESENLKFAFLETASRILQGEPAGAQLDAEVARYLGIRNEVRLVAELDGPNRLAVNQPFGVSLRLQFTANFDRQAGGTNRYFENQRTDKNAGRSTSSRAPTEYRTDFGKLVRHALPSVFEILNPEDMTVFTVDQSRTTTLGPVDSGKPVWLERPLCYLILRVKDSTVRRFPAIQFELDFSDGRNGDIVLPIESSEIDLQFEEPGHLRPVDNLQVAEELEVPENPRELTLQITVSGTGVAPPAASLLHLDSGERVPLGVVGGELKLVDVERGRWRTQRIDTVRYPWPAATNGLFHFPERRGETALKYTPLLTQRDASSREAHRVGNPTAVSGSKRPVYLEIVICVVATLLGGALVYWFVRRRSRARSQRAKDLGDAIVRPATNTPVRFAMFLRSIEALPWTDDERRELELDLAQIDLRQPISQDLIKKWQLRSTDVRPRPAASESHKNAIFAAER